MYTETIPTAIDRTAFGRVAMEVPNVAGFAEAGELASTAIRTETVFAFAAATVAAAGATVSAVTRLTVELPQPIGTEGPAGYARTEAGAAVDALDRARDAGNARDAVTNATSAIDRAMVAYAYYVDAAAPDVV